jgi:ABC-2 type transport system permease protein
MKMTWLMYRKEMLEMVRSYKLLWIPVVFLLLGVMQPIVYFYLPNILASSGDLSAELVQNLPVPLPSEVMVNTLSQFSTIGLLVLVIAGMNIVSGERYSGTAALVLVRSVPSHYFIISKWLGQLTLLVISFTLGYSGAWYYTVQLMGPVHWQDGLAAGALYLLWFAFAQSIILLFSTLLRGSAAAVISILIMAALSLSNSLVPSWFSWSPAHLLSDAAAIFAGIDFSGVAALIVTTLGCLLCLAASTMLLRGQGIPDQP